jgi:replication factor C subunit 3/5
MFLIDKYRPLSGDDKNIFFHKNLLNLLSIMSKDEAVPHTIFYGPNGTGKKTIVNIFLEMLFDKNVHKTKDVEYQVIGSGNKQIPKKIKQSDYHIVIEPSNNGFDKSLIYYIVKEYAKRKSLNVFTIQRPFRIVFINNIDNLSYYAQTSLRRTMEKYNDKCRFIMCCNSLTSVINPLQSRCICMRVPSPSHDEIFKYIFKISLKEKMNLSLEQYSNVVLKSNGNIKDALWHLEFFKQNKELYTNYDESIKKIVKLVLKAELKNILEIIQLYYGITTTYINVTNILIDIINEICMDENLDDILKQKIIEKTAITQYRIMEGRRGIMHFKNFIIYSMKLISENK